MPTGSHVSDQSDRLGVGVGAVQSQNVLYTPEDAQPPQPSGGPRVSFAASGSEYVCVGEMKDEEEDN